MNIKNIVISNRKSYLEKKRKNIDKWLLVSRKYYVYKYCNEKDLVIAIKKIIDENDSLKLYGFMENGTWEEYYKDEIYVENYYTLINIQKNSNDFSDESLSNYIDEKKSKFDLSQNSFHVLVFNFKDNSSLYVFLVHHLIVDAYSYSILLKKFFDKLLLVDEKKDIKKYNLYDYFFNINKYWDDNLNYELSYWDFSSKFNLAPIKYNLNNNNELYEKTRKLSFKFSDDKKNIFGILNIKGNFFIDVLLYSIGQAYRNWFGCDLNIGIVFQGRIGPENRIINDFIGWLSETSPILINSNNSIESETKEIRKQINRSQIKVRGFNQIFYFHNNKIFEYPDICLNINFYKVNNTMNVDKIENSNYKNKPLNTYRPFFLSGGLFFESNAMILSWDYSRLVVSDCEVLNFLNDTGNYFLENIYFLNILNKNELYFNLQ